MKQISATDLSKLTPEELVKYLNEGAKIVDATLPVLKEIWTKIAAFVTSIQTDALSTPKGKRKAIEALQQVTEARNQAQKAENAILHAEIAELKAAVQGLKDKYPI